MTAAYNLFTTKGDRCGVMALAHTGDLRITLDLLPIDGVMEVRDANMLVAALEMLETLKAVVARMATNDSLYFRVRAAIAKAEGRS